jgi:hypothetical protein
MFSKSIKDFFKNPIITVPVILFYLLTGGLSFYSLDPEVLNQLEQAGTTGDMQSIGPEIASFLSAILLIFIVSIFLKPLADSWSNLMTKNVVLKQEPHFRENLKNSFKYYWRMFCFSVLMGLFFIVLLVIFAIICVPLIISAVNGNTTSLTAAAILTIIFILFFIFMSICLMPIPIILIFENLSITKSISKGFSFGVKNFFPIFVSSIPVFIIVLIVSMILFQYTHAVNIVYAYIGMFITVYIMNLYNHKNPPAFEEVPQISNDSDDNYINLSDQ